MRAALPTSMFLALVGAPALAGVPTTITHQGRLFDGTGAPMTDTVEMEFRLFDASSGGTERWSETHAAVAVDGGYFSVVLGEVEPLDADIVDGPVWLELVVDQGSPLSRLELHSVPYAILAEGVKGGVVDASEIRVDGDVVIDGTGAISWDAIDVPSELTDGDDDTLRDLGCTDGQIAKKVGGQWTCVSSSADAPTWDTLDGVPSDLRDGDQVGLTSETDPSVNDLGKADLDCDEDQVAKWDGDAWVCADDVDTHATWDTLDGVPSDLPPRR